VYIIRVGVVVNVWGGWVEGDINRQSYFVSVQFFLKTVPYETNIKYPSKFWSRWIESGQNIFIYIYFFIYIYIYKIQIS